jgi:hypothetical protein
MLKKPSDGVDFGRRIVEGQGPGFLAQLEA